MHPHPHADARATQQQTLKRRTLCYGTRRQNNFSRGYQSYIMVIVRSQYAFGSACPTGTGAALSNGIVAPPAKTFGAAV